MVKGAAGKTVERNVQQKKSWFTANCLSSQSWEVSEPYLGKQKTILQKGFRNKSLTPMTGAMSTIKHVNLIIFDFSRRTQRPEFSVLVMKIFLVYYSCSQTVKL